MTKPIAFVTGAAGGLGKTVVSKLIREGYMVLLNDHSKKQLKEVTKEFKSLNVKEYPFDITDESEWKKVGHEIEKRFGQLDVLINAAGIIDFQTIEDTSLNLWNRTMNVNATSVFLSMKYFSKLFKEALVLHKNSNE